MTNLEHAIKHIKTRADAWAVKEVTEALRSISERLEKALSQEPKTDKPKANKLCEMCGYRKGDWCIRPKDYICKALSQEPTEDKCWYCKHTYEPTMKQFAYYDEVFKEQKPCDDILSLTERVVTQVTEDMDNFIFTTIKPWCEEKEQRKISKRDLEQALTQYFSKEPCDDAIDRAEAMTEIMMSKSITAFDRDLWIRTKDAVHILRELPSVTQKSGNPQPSEHFIDGVHAMGYREGYKDAQKQKSGKWIDYSDEGYVECPFCGHATNCEDNIDELHYCFYCGAKMESEE